ncbi:MAG: hypothetical protein EP330_14355 [Deltaproteobacteria bacterium]|nr:MAG: hypothetical protein EP330_14355 [Deltaproteobacteria bacterium]
MSPRPCILVLHGMTMSGASMLALLGPVADALEAAGFELVAPNAGVALSEAELAGLVPWLRQTYAKVGQDASAWFHEGAFWLPDEARYEWFGARTEGGRKTYTALDAGLAAVASAVEGRHVVGVLGFSQGCAMAALIAGLAKKGALPYGESLRFGVFLSGFLPRFDEPALDPWPIAELRGLCITGTADAFFPGGEAMREVADQLDAPELHVIEGLQHTVPTEPEWVARIASFAAESLR